MIELMATVVLVATCLVAVFRIFSTCAGAISGSSGQLAAVAVLDEKASLLREEAITASGVFPSSDSDLIDTSAGRITYAESVSEWLGIVQYTEPDENGERDEIVKLCEAELEATWTSRGRQRKLGMKTLLPLQGYWDEF
jgi:hypothetical protein